MRARLPMAWLLGVLILVPAIAVRAAEVVDFGLSTSGKRIDALVVETRGKAPPLVAIVGGLDGENASSARVREAVAAYEKSGAKAFRLIAVPVANPDGAALAFPPTGVAYRENAEANALWRYLG
ncbi:MAG: hypothetical protein EOO66_29485, partial [Methylobacterium sp.]